jgi:ABC-type branched-subunit amino acid transport system substrate-binding protein
MEEDGYRVLIQAWDFVPGSNWLAGMQAGTRDAARTIAVVSDAYLTSVYGGAEWQAAMARDLDGSGRKLLVLRISECDLPGLLAGVVGVDLFGVDETVARDRLRDMIAAASSGRAKPSVPPGFPGPGRAVPSEPVFPGGPGEQVPGSPPGPSGGRRRWLVPTASGASVLAVLAVIAVVVWWPGQGASVSTTAKPRLLPRGPCAVSGSAGGQTMVTPWTSPQGDHECVGYSSSSSFIFRNPARTDDGSPQQTLQDERIQYDQEQIFRENIRAEKERGPSRPVIGLVYFAGLTAGRDDDYDSAEAEELEGLLVAQKIALAESNGPLLKVVVANGGSKMQAAVNVARMLVPLFARDPGLLGVLGLDRSVTQVQQAIAMFEARGIPMVATTLSADGIGAGDTYYFQMSLSNSQEASLMLRYIRDVVPAYFEQPARSTTPAARSGPPGS